MKWSIFGLVFLTLPFSNLIVAQNQSKVMIVTGGHDFNRVEFFDMFDRISDIQYQEIVQPEANALIESGQLDEYDLLIFYDMYDSITEGQKEAYLRLADEKKPMLFLHHSLVSYQEWPEFKAMVGGKYHTQDSSRLSYYKHDESINVHIEKQHPITNGLKDFTIVDETYGHCEILPNVLPLLSTDHPRSMPLIGWINKYREQEIVYLQGGHGPTAFRDENFQKILGQAIRYLLTTD